MLNSKLIATVITVALAGAAPTAASADTAGPAKSGSCDIWACGSNHNEVLEQS